MEQDKWLGDYKERNWVVYGKGIYTLRENYDRNIRLAGYHVAQADTPRRMLWNAGI